MRLGVVTQWYDPEGSSAALPGVIARSLAAHGHEVHVITGFPNYPDGVLLDGYRQRPYLRETLQGVDTFIIDEVHAFAGDDRGAHLAAILERLVALCDRDLQRIGLSATVGNPHVIGEWLQ